MSEQLWETARDPMPEEPGELPLILAQKLRVGAAFGDAPSIRIEFSVRRDRAAAFAQAFEGQQATRERARLEAALAAEQVRRREAETAVRPWAWGWAVLCLTIVAGQILEVLV